MMLPMTERAQFRAVVVRVGLWIAALAGYVLLALVLSSRSIDENAGTGAAAADAFAYWSAGRHLIAGQPLYGLFAGGHGAYLYPPIVAQIVAPLSILPLAVFVWAWRAVELLALRSIVGSWRNAGIALLLVPALLGELEAGNVNLVVAAALAALIRGDGRLVGIASIPKFATLAALPAALAIDRRGALRGMAVAGALVMVSIVASFGLWQEYVRFLPQAGDPGNQFYNVGRIVPTPVRFAAAAVFAILAVRAPICAPVAVTLASPVLWFHNLSVLVACVAAFPRLVGQDGRLGPVGSASGPRQPTTTGATKPTTNKTG